MLVLVGTNNVIGTLIYVHGFNSSAQSLKAARLQAFLSRYSNPLECLCPNLPVAPDSAVAMLSRLIEQYNVVGLIGSSLGGYYATYLSHQFGIKSALVNPAVKPFELLLDYIGPNQNPYTGECYEVTHDHMSALKTMYRPNAPRGLIKVWLQRDDEVLDYRQAVDYFGHDRCIVTVGGGHAFADYTSIISDQLAFLGV